MDSFGDPTVQVPLRAQWLPAQTANGVRHRPHRFRCVARWCTARCSPPPQQKDRGSLNPKTLIRAANIERREETTSLEL